MTHNPLVGILPANVRQKIYVAYALIGFIIGAVQVGLSAAGQGQPTWLTVVLAVFAFVGAPLGATAAANVKKPAADPVQPAASQAVTG